MVYSLQDNPFPERPTLEEPMRKLISLLVMILLLLSAALAEVHEVFPDYAGENHLEMTAGFLFPAE